MNLNLEELDPNLVQSSNSNKSFSEEEPLVNMTKSNNTINMVNNNDRSVREYAVFDPNTLHNTIVRP
jgi:hypothetical protein